MPVPLIAIAGKDVRLLLRDRRALLTLIGTPLILTFILGMAFSAMWDTGLPNSLVLWLNGDPGGYGDLLFSQILTPESVGDWIQMEQATDPEAALERVRAGEATAFVWVPEGFSRQVEAGAGTISVAGDPASSIRAATVTGIVSRFAAEVSARAVIHRSLASLGLQAEPDQVEAALLGASLDAIVSDGFDPEPEGQQVLVPLDYYAAGMAVLYLLFTVSRGGSAFVVERQANTLARMHQSPTPSWQIATGKLGGIFATAMIQLLAVILLSRLIFGVSWGDPLGVVVLAAAAAFAASGIGLLIAAVSRTHSAAGALGTAIVLPMAVLGGSTIPLFAMPPIIRSISRLTVNGWAMDGFVRLMFEGAGVSDLMTHVLTLALAGCGLLVAAGLLLARRGVQP